MNAALHVPSGVLISTSFSVTGRSAADVDPAAATMPAAMPIATKSRRESSLSAASSVSWSLRVSSLIDPPILSALSPCLSALLHEPQDFPAHPVGQHIQRVIRSLRDTANACVEIAKQTLFGDHALAVEHERSEEHTSDLQPHS